MKLHKIIIRALFVISLLAIIAIPGGVDSGTLGLVPCVWLELLAMGTMLICGKLVEHD